MLIIHLSSKFSYFHPIVIDDKYGRNSQTKDGDFFISGYGRSLIIANSYSTDRDYFTSLCDVYL